MKSFFALLENITPDTPAPQGKTMVFSFGRFQPPTRGHQVVFDTVKSTAEKLGADHANFPSHTSPDILTTGRDPFERRAERALQNPLGSDAKHAILKKLFPSHNFVNNPELKTAFHVMKHLGSSGYEHLVFVGEEERRSMAEQMKKYVGHADFPGIKSVNFVVSGHRDPDAEGVEGISGTKARQAAIDGDHDAFHAMMPDGAHPDDTKGIMQAVRQSILGTKVAVEQARTAEKEKKRKKLKEEKDPTRKERDHRMYGWGKKNPSKRQLLNRKKKDKRTVARRKANDEGRTQKGDKSVELDHKDGNANNNSSKNLRVVSRKFNRSRNNNKWRKG